MNDIITLGLKLTLVRCVMEFHLKSTCGLLTVVADIDGTHRQLTQPEPTDLWEKEKYERKMHRVWLD